MYIIKDSNRLASKILGLQPPINSEYRLMKYVILVNMDDGILLQNTITGQLVQLSLEEMDIVCNLPFSYVNIMDELIKNYFLVPVNYDEYTIVIQLRKVLHTIEDVNIKGITRYTILPTTACNARCFYCFEAGIETVTMTEKTADNVITFIKNNHCGEKIDIRWFGGEPTVGYKLIDRITTGLKNNGIQYDSDMISNGYLFDEDMVQRAVKLWHLKTIQITLDGTEETYNQVKSYINVTDNPYRRVIRNIQLLLDCQIHVSVRMNVDRYNESILKDLLEELYHRFKSYNNLFVYAWPVFADCGYNPAVHDDEDNKWLGKKLVELNKLSEQYGFYSKSERALPHIKGISCMADNDSAIVIRPGGELVRCLEKFDDNSVVGNVEHGITNTILYQDWKKHAEYSMCKECVFFPRCIRLKYCGTSDICYEKDKYLEYTDIVKDMYSLHKDKIGGINQYERI